MPGLITFLSDYGLRDPFVGICHAVIAALAPEARVLDLTHGIARHDVRHGALVLTDALPWLPAAVHLAVVDPGVGTARRAVAVAAGDAVLIGPDNGLLWPAVERLGGVRGAWQISEPAYLVTPVSHTFHGRDVFAPAAAHVAAGVDPSAFGPPVTELVELRFPEPSVAPGQAAGQVLAADGFGNLQLNLRVGDLERAGFAFGAVVQVRVAPDASGPGARRPDARGGVAVRSARLCATFSDVPVGDLALLEDSFGRVALAVNSGSAATELAAGPDSVVWIQGLPDRG